MSNLAGDELRAAQETIQRQKQLLGTFLLERHEPIAVVGVGLRFPGGDQTPGGNQTLDGFADFLSEGRSGIGPLPEDRWAPTGTADPELITTVAGGFLGRIDEFDAQFFGISPKQAPYVDPSQRLLLETAWEALENAGLDAAALRHGNGGIYVGASPLDFTIEASGLSPDQLVGDLGTGMGAYSLSGRLSYFLGWRGPSLTTDTACASSLTALHLAVGGLRRHETDIALCGAVNTLHHPRTFAILSQGQFLSPDGHCKTFDEAADGYARAEGCGVLVLKRVSDALRDGDTVLALVRGTAIGQDGESAGLTAPNGTAQEAVMRAALDNARLQPGDIQYVEAHGTGTPLGDPIEMSSINGVFGAAHRDGPPLTVGSLKANLGHMEPAAGIGGIIKVVLQMREGRFFPHLMQTPSGRIPWDTYPVRVPASGGPWEEPVRRAVVNGFGVAGAIGIAVLEEAPRLRQEAVEPVEGGSHVFTLSAKSRSALALQAERYQRFLDDNPEVSVADLCFTRGVGRSHFKHRMAGVVSDTAGLRALLEKQQPPVETLRKVAFLFPGSGSQYAGMGRALYERFPVFRQYVDQCDALFRPHLDRSITEVMFEDAEALAETVFTHASLFTLEYALARLWLSWGVRPSVLVGHSVGEIVAATVAGLFTPGDGVKFLVNRARLIQSVQAPGGMAAVAASADEVRKLISPWRDLAIAAVNSPDQCVVSGGAASLDAAVAALREQGMTVTRLRVAAAFHSPLMAGISERLRAVFDDIDFHEPTMTIVSNLTGTVGSPKEMATADYWVRHLNQTVEFAASVRTVADRGKHVFLEIGPAMTLAHQARRCVPADQHRWLGCLNPHDTTDAPIHQALAGIYTAGLNLSWAQVYADQPARKAVLPAYAFDRQRYRLPLRTAATGGHPLLGREIDSADGREFAVHLSATSTPYLADHTVEGQVFVPAAAYVEMFLALGDAVHGDTTLPIEDLRFHEALFLTDRPTEIRIRTESTPDARWSVDIASRTENGAERLHVTGFLRTPESSPESESASPARKALQDRAASAGAADQILDAPDVYAAYRRSGLDYGPHFRRVQRVARYGADFTVSELRADGTSPAEYLPPPLMDAATHGLAALADDGNTYVSVGIARLRVFKKPRAEHLQALLQITRNSGAFTADALLLEGDRPVMELSGMAFTRLERRLVEPVPQRRTPTTGLPTTGLPTTDLPTAATGSARRRAVSDLIRRAVADLLAIGDSGSVDADATFLELGMDSLVAIKLRDLLETELGVPLTASVIFDHPTAERLAEFLDHQLTRAA